MADLDAYAYYPSLRTRMWELRGYKELVGVDKDRLLPIFTISRYSRTVSADGIVDVLVKSTDDRPIVLDLEASPIFACSDVANLLDPSNAFSNWRAFVQRRPTAIPTALMPAGAPLRDVVRQVVAFERSNQSSAFQDLHWWTFQLSAPMHMNSADNLLIVLDFGYVRSAIAAKAIEAADAINAIRSVEASARIVVMETPGPLRLMTTQGQR